VSFADPSEPVPAELRTDEFVLRPIRATDAELDYRAVMETREYLRLWEQSTWPADDFTVDANREDLVGLEERHDAHRAFTYTVLDPDGVECLGCVYVTSERFTQQADLIDSTDLILKFELLEPDKPGKYLVFG
jgi:RimJ/RimL family protein N-acetyltransferase